MKIIDGHIHIFERIDGANAQGPVRGCGLGRTENAGVVSAFMPPLTSETCFTVPMLLETMRQNGVEAALLLQNPTIGDCNALIGQAILDHPGVLAGVVQVDPFAADASAQLERWVARYPYAALKLELSTGWGWTGIHQAAAFYYEQLEELVSTAGRLGLAVIFDTGDTNSHAYRPDDLRRLAARHPSISFVVEHGGYLTPGGNETAWEQMLECAREDNVFLGICAMGSLLEDAYPCPQAGQRLRQLHRRFGAKKLIWGTDAPCTLKSYTYAQMRDTILLHADFLRDEEKELIMGGNARRLYF